MARYLVTGGAGFIGSHLTEELLAAQHEVVVLDNLTTGDIHNIPQKAVFIKGDILDQELLKNIMANVDGCFHLAAVVSVPQCDVDWLNSFKTNVNGTFNILYEANEQNVKHRVPVVFASSTAIYGANNHLPLTEMEIPSPISSYGFHKTDCEHYAFMVNQLYHLPFTALRLFNVYGPRQRAESSYSGVISQFCNHLKRNEPIFIYGDGEQTRDFIFVNDVVRFFMRAMETSSETMRIYNVCTGKRSSINHIAHLLSNIYATKFQPIYKEARFHDIYHSLGSFKKAKQELGIVAEVEIHEGLEKLTNFLNESRQTTLR